MSKKEYPESENIHEGKILKLELKVKNLEILTDQLITIQERSTQSMALLVKDYANIKEKLRTGVD